MAVAMIRRTVAGLSAIGALLLVMMFAQSAVAQQRTDTITVQEKEQRFFPLQHMPARVAIGDPDVVDVQVLEAESGRQAGLMLFGNRPGSTQLQVWNSGSSRPQVWTVTVGPETTDVSSMVQVEVKVVELSRNVMKEAGIDWWAGKGVGKIGAVGGQTWAGGGSLMPQNALANGFSLLYRSSDFMASLALLESNGMGRVLAEPTLVAMSGQSASFLAGGEIPVPTASAQGSQSVEYKPFGIGLTVAPTVLAPNRIALKIAPEASELDFANAIPVSNGAQTTLMPAIRTRRADTTIELGDGESFVISGLVSRETQANVNKFPFLGEIPIIGAFVRSVNYTQEDRELVIVVTPRLVRPFAKNATIPLPGAKQEVTNTGGNAWGHYLLGPDMGHQMPGFSR